MRGGRQDEENRVEYYLPGKIIKCFYWAKVNCLKATLHEIKSIQRGERQIRMFLTDQILRQPALTINKYP